VKTKVTTHTMYRADVTFREWPGMVFSFDADSRSRLMADIRRAGRIMRGISSGHRAAKR
jgi:hypothetical protein